MDGYYQTDHLTGTDDDVENLIAKEMLRKYSEGEYSEDNQEHINDEILKNQQLINAYQTDKQIIEEDKSEDSDSDEGEGKEEDEKEDFDALRSMSNTTNLLHSHGTIKSMLNAVRSTITRKKTPKYSTDIYNLRIFNNNSIDSSEKLCYQIEQRYLSNKLNLKHLTSSYIRNSEKTFKSNRFTIVKNTTKTDTNIQGEYRLLARPPVELSGDKADQLLMRNSQLISRRSANTSNYRYLEVVDNNLPNCYHFVENMKLISKKVKEDSKRSPKLSSIEQMRTNLSGKHVEKFLCSLENVYETSSSQILQYNFECLETMEDAINFGSQRYSIDAILPILYSMERALRFLHCNVGILHNAICPASIFYDSNGNYKLGHFDCSVRIGKPGEKLMEKDVKFINNAVTQAFHWIYQNSSSKILKYSSPELLMQLTRQASQNMILTPFSDIYSLVATMFDISTLNYPTSMIWNDEVALVGMEYEAVLKKIEKKVELSFDVSSYEYAGYFCHHKVFSNILRDVSLTNTQKQFFISGLNKNVECRYRNNMEEIKKLSENNDLAQCINTMQDTVNLDEEEYRTVNYEDFFNNNILNHPIFQQLQTLS
ncbi:hypothetical protein SNEBB_004088 [Seison nebaliae]|nr:hypothetical protein SNEBB_004088 [Seison nebaliae]